MILQIKEKRIEAGMSQCELADKINVNQTAVSQWERGASLPGCEKLPEIAKALQCSINDLFNGGMQERGSACKSCENGAGSVGSLTGS